MTFEKPVAKLGYWDGTSYEYVLVLLIAPVGYAILGAQFRSDTPSIVVSHTTRAVLVRYVLVLVLVVKST